MSKSSPRLGRAWLAVTVPLILAAASPAQEGDPAAPQEQPTPEARLEALVERLNAARQEFYAAYDKAQTDAEKDAVFAQEPSAAFVPEFKALAESIAGTEPAAQAWIWVVRLGQRVDGGAPAKEALGVLTSRYVDSPALGDLARELEYAGHGIGFDTCEGALRTVLEKSPLRAVQARAQYVLARTLMRSRGRQLSEEAALERRAEARKLFVDLAERFGAEDAGRDRTYAAQAERNLFEIDHLQIGMVAPDFECTDADGVKFKLSDYRGKVVVVDFWGDW
ncbi:MAG TPA: redoxin domain-containing protein [Planctomycetota bacterium]|nr:redoxin domain-containing protein [Planctomycetota bacterium]